jgi:flagellar hook-length control protein FliK
MIPANAVPQLNSKNIAAPSDASSSGSSKTVGAGQKDEFKAKLDQAVQGDAVSGRDHSPEEVKALRSELEKSDEDSSKEVNEAFVQTPVLPNQDWSQLASVDSQSEQSLSELKQDPKGVKSDLRNPKPQGQESQGNAIKGGENLSLLSSERLIPLEGFEASLLDANPINSGLQSLEAGDVELTSGIQDGSGTSLEKLLSNSTAKIEELKTNIQSDLGAVNLEKAPSLPSRVSTEDFLTLRELRKGKNPRESSLPAGASGMDQTLKGPLHLGPVVEAPVTQGTAGKAVLSHDAIHQISQQVNLLGKARQDGEIKIRLKPDHLGELVMNVKSRGNEVSIQIKTHDLEAKKIIEESIGRLKESLSVQNLSLSKMDVVSQSPGMQSADQSMQMDFNQGQTPFGRGDSQGWNDSGRGTRQEFLYDEVPVSATLKSMGAARSARTSGAGNLDLIA